MTKQKKWSGIVPMWGPAPLIERLRECRFMLYQHGILTESESDRADQRIEKKRESHGIASIRMTMKLCILCDLRPREVPDREEMGRPIRRVCRECHRRRLAGDLQAILAERDKRRSEQR